MKPLFIFCIILFSFIELNAQTGIGTSTPNASAKLDVTSATQGFLPPRVVLTATNVFAPITGIAASATGLLVFNTASAGTSPTNVSPGYYYWNGTAWLRLINPTDNATNITYGTFFVTERFPIADGLTDLENIELPSAGTYKITHTIRASVTASNTIGMAYLQNGSGVQIVGSEVLPIFGVANVQATGTKVTVVTTTGAETIKLRVFVQNGSMHVRSDGNGRSTVLWEKIK